MIIPTTFCLTFAVKEMNNILGFVLVLFFLLSMLLGGLIYIISRCVTLVLAFTSPRDLPPAAYETVHWTTFIPHV